MFLAGLLWQGAAQAVPRWQGLDWALRNPALVQGVEGVESGQAGLLGADEGPLLTFMSRGDHAGTPGQGLFVAAPAGDSFASGLGIQRLQDGDGHETRKASLAMAFGARGASVGLGWNVVSDSSWERVAGWWDLSLLLRPARWISLAAVLRNVREPLVGLGTSEVPVGLEAGLALRPIAGASWLTLSGGLTMVGATEDDLEPESGTCGVELVPFGPLAMGVQARFDQEGLAGLGVTVGLHQGRFGLGVEQGVDSSGGAVDDSMGWRVDLYGARHPAVIPSPRPRLLVVSLDGRYPERRRSGLLGTEGPTFLDLLEGLDLAARDPGIDTVLVQIGPLDASMARVQELRAALRRLSVAGKRVVVHLPEAGTKAYYLATAGDEIVMPPGSPLLLLGLSMRFTYLERTLAKAKVEAHFVRIGKYKSAPDTFTRSDMSQAQREVETSMADDLYETMVSDMAKARGTTIDQMKALVDRGPYVSSRAKELGLVDRVAHWHLVRKELSEGRAVIEDVSRLRPWDPEWGDAPRIAVIPLTGAMVMGRGPTSPFGVDGSGAATLCKWLDEAAASRSVEAIVLRIDSPGGSATAAEIIHEHVGLAAEKKPVIVSMGSVAASGGYYAAVAGDTIFASPGTITGSIGVFTGKFELSGLLDWLGVGRVTIKRGSRADLGSLDRGFTQEELQAIQEGLQATYDLFVERVAAGRRMSQDQVRRVAQGRVWTGAQAKAAGLVDRLGGLWDAILEAKSRAGLEPDEPVRLWSPVQKVPLPLTSLVSGDHADGRLARAVTEALPGLPLTAVEVAWSSPGPATMALSEVSVGW